MLRQLYIEKSKGGNKSLLSQVNRNYKLEIKYYCNNKILKGNPYPLCKKIDDRYVKDIRNLSFADLHWSHQNQIKTDIKGITKISNCIVID